jgi:hypothetical protein
MTDPAPLPAGDDGEISATYRLAFYFEHDDHWIDEAC